jgi:hypothetical protein
MLRRTIIAIVTLATIVAAVVAMSRVQPAPNRGQSYYHDALSGITYTIDWQPTTTTTTGGHR